MIKLEVTEEDYDMIIGSIAEMIVVHKNGMIDNEPNAKKFHTAEYNDLLILFKKLGQQYVSQAAREG